MAQPTEDNIYPYNPSLPAAAIFCALNAIWLLWHTYLCFWLPRSQTYKHRYTIPLFVACLLSTAGWLVRIINCNDLSSIPLYAISASYIVISPIFVCATLYLLLKCLVNLCLSNGPDKVLFGINPRWLGRIFITSDVLSFLTQCSGSGIASSGNWEGNTKEIGVNVLLVGLALQLATFTFYLAFLWQFVCRVRRVEQAGFNPSVRKVIMGIWIASAFVQVHVIPPPSVVLTLTLFNRSEQSSASSSSLSASTATPSKTSGVCTSSKPSPCGSHLGCLPGSIPSSGCSRSRGVSSHRASRRNRCRWRR